MEHPRQTYAAQPNEIFFTKMSVMNTIKAKAAAKHELL
jgi:hypothetical protein